MDLATLRMSYMELLKRKPTEIKSQAEIYLRRTGKEKNKYRIARECGIT